MSNRLAALMDDACICGHPANLHSDHGNHICCAEDKDGDGGICECMQYTPKPVKVKCATCGAPTVVKPSTIGGAIGNAVVPSVDRLLDVNEGYLCCVCEELVNSVLEQNGLVRAQEEYLREQARIKAIITGNGYIK